MKKQYMRIGYYLFLGNGDYHCPLDLDKKWIATWNLDDWKAFIKKLQDMEVNTLMIYFNGHKLPYNSKLYPELIDHNHSNVQHEFVPDLLKYIKQQKIQIIAVITTTGHAGGFSEISPNSRIEVKKVELNIEDTLISFPEHIRKGKTSQKSGAAQVGHGVLCHNKSTSRGYAENILQEIIELYGEYFDGIAFHPPEAVYPCECELCCEKYKKEYGENLNNASLSNSRMFFITSYLNYQNEVLTKLANKLIPSSQILSFTVPWLFESDLTNILRFISNEISIIDWDYNLEQERICKLSKRIHEYHALGYKVWFMPTAGFSFTENAVEDQIESVHAQLDIAEDSGVDGIIHFLGPKLSEYLVETSRAKKIEKKSTSPRFS